MARIPLKPINPNSNLARQRRIEALTELVEILFGIVKANDLHQENCAVTEYMRHNLKGQTYMYPRPCDCIISEVE